MIHFRSKNDIIQWLEKHCPRKAVVRSLSQNGCELLGGFNPIPPTTRAGWIVRVTSIYNKRMWIVAIIPHKSKSDCEIRILKYVPWENWVGMMLGMPPIMLGDKPELYCKFRQLLRRKDESVQKMVGK